MKAYICGPMTGYKDFNRVEFERVTFLLRQMGHTVVSPVELNTKYGVFPCREWAPAMKVDIAALMECDTIVLLDGWENSRGATMEHSLALQVGITILTTRNFLLPASHPGTVGSAT